jgi:hypothetical protein
VPSENYARGAGISSYALLDVVSAAEGRLYLSPAGRGRPRSSRIISDEPPNRETNYGSVFVVVLNNRLLLRSKLPIYM